MLPIFSALAKAGSTVGNAVGSAGSAFGNTVAKGAVNAAQPVTNLFKGGQLSPTGETMLAEGNFAGASQNVLPSAGQQLLNMIKGDNPVMNWGADAFGFNESHAPMTDATFQRLHPDIQENLNFKPAPQIAQAKSNSFLRQGLNFQGDQQETESGGIVGGFLKGFGLG